MSQTMKRSGQFVVPGDRLGVIEEFMSGSGTYIEQGIIYSNITGRVLLDVLNKEVSVYPLVSAANVPQIGSVVDGQVLRVQSKRAILRIMKIEKTSLAGFFTGLLHISEVSRGYIESMFEAYKAGDLMRAKVISDKNRTYQLSTADKELGVIYAFCSRCGHPLELRRQKTWCNKCKKIDRRKVSLDYGSSTQRGKTVKKPTG